ncbi:hypothetical protein GCM10010199_66420 [Dactylosporangium roseum]
MIRGRRRAAYTRPHGVRHLFAALDLGRDVMYGQVKKRRPDLCRAGGRAARGCRRAMAAVVAVPLARLGSRPAIRGRGRQGVARHWRGSIRLPAVRSWASP